MIQELLGFKYLPSIYPYDQMNDEISARMDIYFFIWPTFGIVAKSISE